MTIEPVKFAIAQMCTTADIDANLARIADLMAEAAAQGAKAITLPENCALMASSEAQRQQAIEVYGLQGSVQSRLAALAKQHQLWLFAGSHPIDSGVPGRPYQRMLCYTPDGGVAGCYDKIHLFDVDISATESYHESTYTLPGRASSTVLSLPFGMIGLSICFDIRFPNLYQKLREMGAQILLIPSAFTRPTGRAHWLPLLQARAIETQCYVLASAQYGDHGNGRTTWGHSCVIDPWGEVLVDMGDSSDGVVVVDIDLAKLAAIRQRMPLESVLQ